MTHIKIRKGDIVTVRIQVTEVADYDDGQQVMGKALPNGFNTSWLIPKETEVTLVEQDFRIGDTIYVGTALKATGKILAHSTDGGESWLWVRMDGDGSMVTIPVTKDTRRVG